jgi:hypothetical protein
MCRTSKLWILLPLARLFVRVHLVRRLRQLSCIFILHLDFKVRGLLVHPGKLCLSVLLGKNNTRRTRALNSRPPR